MKPILQLEKTPARQRTFFVCVASLWLSLALALVAFPAVRLAHELEKGNINWPLVGLLGLFVPSAGVGVYLAWSYWVWFLPCRFTVDFNHHLAGYRWRNTWLNRIDLTGVTSLITAPAWSRWTWGWIVYANIDATAERRLILNSSVSYGSELEAYQGACAIGDEIARYLEVPLEGEDWSPELLGKHFPIS